MYLKVSGARVVLQLTGTPTFDKVELTLVTLKRRHGTLQRRSAVILFNSSTRGARG